MKPATVLSVLQLVAAGVVVNRLRHGAQPVPQPAAVGNPPTVSVVIPARNESLRISPCLEALAEIDVREVIVVDDCSTDVTPEVAERYGATVVTGAPLPDGWVGKPWALQQGLEAASGDVVLFLDADTIPTPAIVDKAVATLCSPEQSVDFASFTARFRCATPAETALHTSMLATIAYRFGPPWAPLSPERKIANGQCMAVRRQWLLDEGGFALVAANMTDDIALARALAVRGANVVFRDGSDAIDVDMHQSAGEVWREWGRSLPMHDASSQSERLRDLLVLWLTLGIPWLRLLSGRPSPVDALLIAMRTAMNAAFGASYRAPAIGRWLSPFTDVPALVRITQATVRPVRTWRGRTYS